MLRREKDFRKKDSLADWENIAFVSFGRAADDDLPQVESDEDVIIDLMQERTHHPREQVVEEIHRFNKKEPS